MSSVPSIPSNEDFERATTLITDELHEMGAHSVLANRVLKSRRSFAHDRFMLTSAGLALRYATDGVQRVVSKAESEVANAAMRGILLGDYINEKVYPPIRHYASIGMGMIYPDDLPDSTYSAIKSAGGWGSEKGLDLGNRAVANWMTEDLTDLSQQHIDEWGTLLLPEIARRADLKFGVGYALFAAFDHHSQLYDAMERRDLEASLRTEPDSD